MTHVKLFSPKVISSESRSKDQTNISFTALIFHSESFSRKKICSTFWISERFPLIHFNYNNQEINSSDSFFNLRTEGL